MSASKRYTIDYTTLPNGVYSYNWAVDGLLFHSFESEDVKDADCQAAITLHKADRTLNLDIAINGTATTICDRCLDDCTLPIEFEGQLEVRLTDGESDYDGEQMLLPYGEILDLSQYIYESVILSLPVQRVHLNGECDPDMLARFTAAPKEEE